MKCLVVDQMESVVSDDVALSLDAILEKIALRSPQLGRSFKGSNIIDVKELFGRRMIRRDSNHALAKFIRLQQSARNLLH